jgi:hypothetical protein
VSIDALKKELRALSAENRRKLVAFMITLEDQGRAGYAAELARRIDERSPERWLTAADCERELGLADDQK